MAVTSSLQSTRRRAQQRPCPRRLLAGARVEHARGPLRAPFSPSILLAGIDASHAHDVLVSADRFTESAVVSAPGTERVMLEAANLFADRSPIVQFDCLRRGLWQTKSLWARRLTFDRL